jgi:hypothetical protein
MNNKNKYPESSKPGFFEKHPGARNKIAAASISLAAGGLTVAGLELTNNPAPSVEVSHNTDITPKLEAQLDDIQRQLDTPNAPPEVAAFKWNQISMPGTDPSSPSIQFEIQASQDIIQSAEEAYEQMTGQPMPASAKDSLTVTARHYEERLVDEGQDPHLSVGTILDLTDVKIDGDNVERAVVSNSVVDEAPPVQPQK